MIKTINVCDQCLEETMWPARVGRDSKADLIHLCADCYDKGYRIHRGKVEHWRGYEKNPEN